MNTFTYERLSALQYANKWAFLRNPAYYNFDKFGGDCTNFISQCLFAGCKIMNFTPTFGWYYNNINDRAPAWSGVNEFYRFITTNNSYGPFGKLSTYYQMQIGDVIQLFNGQKYYHSLFISSIIDREIFTASHTINSFDKPLSSYNFVSARYIKILGYRK